MNELEYTIQIYDSETEEYKHYAPKIYINNEWENIVPYFGTAQNWQLPEINIPEPEPDHSNDPYITFSSPTIFELSHGDAWGYDYYSSWDGTMYYSTNQENWYEWDGTPITAVADNNVYKVFLRGSDNTYTNGEWSDSSTGYHCSGENISISGNIATLLDWETVTLGQLPQLYDSAFGYMFSADPWQETDIEGEGEGIEEEEDNICFKNSIVDVSNLILPFLTLSDNCYKGMFYGCVNLINTPMLPATILGNFCYEQMFFLL